MTEKMIEGMKGTRELRQYLSLTKKVEALAVKLREAEAAQEEAFHACMDKYCEKTQQLIPRKRREYIENFHCPECLGRGWFGSMGGDCREECPYCTGTGKRYPG